MILSLNPALSSVAPRAAGAAQGPGNAVELPEGIERASQLIGKEILSPRGKRLGVVHDLLFGPEGNITFLLLSRGSAFGLLGPFFPIPWEAARARPSPEGIIVAITEQTLEDAPSFEVGNLPKAFSQKQVRQIREYYAGHSGTPQ